LIGVAGFLVGQFNYEFTTCHDYAIAGNDLPSNCRNAPTPTPAQSTSPTPSPTQ
jgi:hypothetical protein